VASGGLLNASGYTGYLDDALDEILPTDATLHPYILHYRDYSAGNYDPSNTNGFADCVNPSGYLVMPMGGDEDIREYEFDFTNAESVDFILAIGCTYGISADNKNMRLSPIYRLPQFNKKAASEVSIEITSNNLIQGVPTSDATLTVSVLDMNHGVAVGEGLGEMRAASDIAQISVEVSSVTASPVVVSSPTPTGGDPRDPLNPLTYEITFTNDASGVMGFHRGLVKITDSYPAGENEFLLLNGADGITRVGPTSNPLEGCFNISEFAAYQTFIIEVIGNQAPVCDLDASSEEIYSGSTIDLFPGPGTSDPDGDNIVLYEYDFDYDGTTFDVDGSNTTGAPVTTTPFSNPGTDPIVVDVATRITDDGIPAATSDICTLAITVNPLTLDINFLSTPAEVTSSPFGNHGQRLDPCICLEDDGQYAMAYVYKYYGGTSDTVLGLHSSNGISWYWTQGMIGTSGLGPPCKVAADQGDTDSYAYFSVSSNPDDRNYIAKTGGSYEYTWNNKVPFDHFNELYGSATSGYLYAFGDDYDKIECRRSGNQHLINESWNQMTVNVSYDDPRISNVRSVHEDSTGIMFLAYYNVNENIIKSIKSVDSMGNSWTEGTIWDGTSSDYIEVKDPGVFIDSNDTINVSFERHNNTSGLDEICYVQSTDGGTSFSTPVVVTSSSGSLLNAPIVYVNKFGYDIIVIAYESDDDIYVALSGSYGATFIPDFLISDFADAESDPDLIVDNSNNLILAWQLDDSVHNGSIYSCKVEIIEN